MNPSITPEPPLPPGNTRICIDLAGCATKAELLDRTARAFKFPDWFGHNWDALADCLTDLSWLPASGYTVVIAHAQGLRQAEPGTWSTFLDVLQEASAFWKDEGIDVLIVDADDHRRA